MQILKTNLVTVIILAIVVLFGSIIIARVAGPTQTAYGSVARGGEYFATTTRNVAGVAMLSLQLISATTTNTGTLGSVIITGAGAGEVDFYDATTSNVSLRAASMSSTTQLIASIPANAAAGTYTFDASYFNGLLVEIIGTAPTSTITYRFN